MYTHVRTFVSIHKALCILMFVSIHGALCSELFSGTMTLLRVYMALLNVYLCL